MRCQPENCQIGTQLLKSLDATSTEKFKFDGAYLSPRQGRNILCNMHLLFHGLPCSVFHDIEALHSIPQSSELVESSLASNPCPSYSSSEFCFSPLVSQRTLLLTVWFSDQRHQHPMEAVHKVPPRLKNGSLRSVPSLELTRSKNGHL